MPRHGERTEGSHVEEALECGAIEHRHNPDSCDGRHRRAQECPGHVQPHRGGHGPADGQSPKQRRKRPERHGSRRLHPGIGPADQCVQRHVVEHRPGVRPGLRLRNMVPVSGRREQPVRGTHIRIGRRLGGHRLRQVSQLASHDGNGSTLGSCQNDQCPYTGSRQQFQFVLKVFRSVASGVSDR